ncbi:Diaminopimelate epimerase [Chlamydiales bacterium STE3]|nr:Diaminopimelate epimerase [Chlamydiales bacterium STE3]
MTEIAFSKYSGCGNDFLLIDNRDNHFPAHNSGFIARMCHRPSGVGADGVILLEQSQTADFKMRIYNADGSEAEMCGNGLRCLKKFIREKGITASPLKIETMTRQHQVELIADCVKATMGEPTDIQLNLSLSINGKTHIVHFLNTGVPHVIQFVDDLEKAPVEALGRTLRYHPHFMPRGANANFVTITESSSLSVRTYERGVEQETLACGTGATASAIAAALLFQLPAPIQIKTRSGQFLTIDFTIDEHNQITNVTQSGPATYHFKGSFALSKEDLCH